MAKYFDKFPLIEYDGKLARNLLVNVDFTEQSKRDIYSNFDYVISDNLARPDTLSNINYNSPYYDWLIYYSNNVVDPYYDFYMSEQNLEKFIIQKYGSIQNANQTILFYRNNWAPDDSEVKVDVYNSLDSSIQKYYRPKLNNFNQVIAYERRKEDWIQSTNKIIEIPVDSTENLSIGDRYINGDAYGYINSINSELFTIKLQHVTGTFEDEIVLVLNIPTIESSFWTPVSAYDYELEQNELKKHINLIKNSYLPDIEKKFQEQLK